ncbi:hypothetical protein DSO57_1021479 [Entomophthora muscae]|uniref:Uncharacterized protein n=1 Tax=Entomophthora muscae TaxID=34485 RepID=A0ACC2UCC8_9FUNG|nr:hypothetical protein DSO57_1021479 [Entomophthora muscae]
MPPAQDFSKLRFVYITVLGLTNQAVPHTGSWRSLATAVNYLVRIASIVYLAFQARPASPVGVQPDSGMGHENKPTSSYPSLLMSCLGQPKCATLFLDNEPSDSCGSVVGGHPSYSPACEVIKGYNDGPYNIKGPLLKGFHGLDR